MRIQNKRLLASILFMLISIVCIAVQPDPIMPPPPPGPPPPVGLPIDGGVLIAALVALFYGTKKLLKNN